MGRRIGIIGAGRFGTDLARELSAQGVEVIVLDQMQESIQRIVPFVSKAVTGDATDRQVLAETGIAECDVVVVAISENMESSILTTMSLKEMGIGHIVARAHNDIHAKVLEKIGADRVLNPVRDMAVRLARSLLAASIEDYVEVSEGVSVVEIKATDKWIGRTLAELKLPSAYGVTVLALQRLDKKKKGKKQSMVVPSADVRIMAGDTLIVFGEDAKLRSLSNDAQ